MLYAILCYNDEKPFGSWPKDKQDAVMEKLEVIQQKLAREGRLGPAARLSPSTAAKTLRKDREPPLVVDGPFAETKEQLLGFYIVNCDSIDEAVEIARDLGRAVPAGAYEIRPVSSFREGAISGG
ncbi:MAG: YciI family protein [Bryobacteraceae bacterium]